MKKNPFPFVKNHIINLLKPEILNFFKKRKRYLSRMRDLSELRTFISDLRPWQTNHSLIRIGPDRDGGYLIPNDLEDISLLISPGVGNEIGFERQCADLGMTVHLIDGSVSDPSAAHSNFVFHPVFLGIGKNEITLGDFIGSLNLEDHPGDWMLQMDIEGAEWENLIHIPNELLNRFRILVIEFHHLDNLFSRPYFNLVKKVFEKLLINFQIVHIHPNNFTNAMEIDNISIPRNMEFTFLRKDRIKKSEPAVEFPHPLDKDCNDGAPSLHLPKCWYDRNTF